MKNSLKIFLFSLCAAFIFTACSSTDSSQDADTLDGSLSESNLNGVNGLNGQLEGRYGDGTIPLAEAEGMFKDVNFGFDSATLDDFARQNLEQNVKVLQSQPSLQIQLEGHCDERGTAEYNFALGSRRAQAVFDMLVSYGIQASRLKIISYGEEVPLDPTSNETAWAKNRRVHFAAYTNNQ